MGSLPLDAFQGSTSVLGSSVLALHLKTFYFPTTSSPPSLLPRLPANSSSPFQYAQEGRFLFMNKPKPANHAQPPRLW